MKKLLLLILLSTFLFSCDDDSWKTELEAIKTELANQKALIEALQNNATITGIEQGEGSYTIHFSDGQSITLTNGQTPIINIGENGNWFINGVDTGKPSQGEDGMDGTDGIDGQTPSIEIGENGNWFINGVDTEIKAEGINGMDAPYIISIVEKENLIVFSFSDGSLVTCIKDKQNAILYDFLINKNLNPGERISLLENYIQTNLMMTSKVTFENIGDGFLIGRGYMAVTGSGIEINGSNIILHQYWQGKDIAKDTVEHGLLIKSPLYISFKVKDYQDYSNHRKTYLEILNSDGAVFNYTIENDLFRGAPFVQTKNSALTIESLTMNCFDLQHELWTFGDSYYEFGWLQNLYKFGYYRFLSDFYAGEGSSQALKCLKNNLNFSTPKYIVWGEGVNDSSDKDIDTPNSIWMKNTEELIRICKENNITPIFLTFPSLTDNEGNYIRDHRAKNLWIRNSGYRFCDISSVLEDGNGIWYEGLRGSGDNNIHPTAKGNYLITIQILNDIPEFMY